MHTDYQAKQAARAATTAALVARGNTMRSKPRDFHELDTEIVLPTLHEPIDHVPACRGDCRQGRDMCTSPMTCRMGTHMHRIWPIVSHPSDDVYRSTPIDQIDDPVVVWLLIVAAVLSVAIFAYAWLVSGYPVRQP